MTDDPADIRLELGKARAALLEAEATVAEQGAADPRCAAVLATATAAARCISPLGHDGPHASTHADLEAIGLENGVIRLASGAHVPVIRWQ